MACDQSNLFVAYNSANVHDAVGKEIIVDRFN